MAQQVEVEDGINDRLDKVLEDKSNGFTSKKYLVSRAVEQFLDELENNSSLEEYE